MAQSGVANVPTGSNLAMAYQETLTSIVRLKAGRQTVSDAHYFRQQFIEALKQANEEGRRRGYSDEAIREGRFAVVAFLDETVLNLRSNVFADWPRKPLQEELFGVHMGGEVFFQNLEGLMRQPDSPHLADTLEVYLLCLTLGYAGKYSVSGRGELLSLRQLLLSRVQRIRGRNGELSPHWRPALDPNLKAGGDPWLRPLLYATILSCILLILLFFAYKVSLHAAASQVAGIAPVGEQR